MPTLTIHNVEAEVRDRLLRQAAAHGRSMEEEVRRILSEEVRRSQEEPGKVARRIHARFQRMGGADDLPTPDRPPAPEPMTFDE